MGLGTEVGREGLSQRYWRHCFPEHLVTPVGDCGGGGCKHCLFELPLDFFIEAVSPRGHSGGRTGLRRDKVALDQVAHARGRDGAAFYGRAAGRMH